MPGRASLHLASVRGRQLPSAGLAGLSSQCRCCRNASGYLEPQMRAKCPAGAKSTLCWTLAVCVLGSAVAPETTRQLITRTLRLTTFLKNDSTELRKIYLQQMGSPFSDPEFSLPRRHLEGVPDAEIPILTWFNLSAQERLGADLGALSILLKLLEVMAEDLMVLGDSSSPPGKLLGQLNAHRSNVNGLVTGLCKLLSALGYTPPTLPLPLATPSCETSAFECKVRGYLICRNYMGWLARTERDLGLLSHSVSSA
ncbi:cardiotrophin-2 [Hypanus sabinus]|uniref:cardiotrophin-2 n=1 Tax=Hypanus sabinus TaxID=79690 RepID=UPI0028C49B8A|nr:cardiotrophin-2 [Hypanus sabinus]